MLKLKFDAKLDFQIESINSVLDLFKGQTRRPQNLTFAIVSNLLDLSKEPRFIATIKDYESFEKAW